MTRVFDPKDQNARYAPLGLVANPFFGVDATANLATCCEIASASNQLLRAIVNAAREDKPRPIWVAKDPDIPSSYSLAAESRVEQSLRGDGGLNVVYGYIPLFGMRDGAVRSVLTLLGERIVWSEFDKTLAAHVGRILAEPDEGLATYQAMDGDTLEAFSAAFASDPVGTVCAVLGEPIDERLQGMDEAPDFRQLEFVGDGADEASGDTDEIDETVRDAPGIDLAAHNEGVEGAEAQSYPGVADYIIEHTGEHLSPALGRVLRVYRERGLRAASSEINITKAPRKTLTALVKFARSRYSKIVLMWDSFESWREIESDLRSKIVGLLSELRWSLDGDVVCVFLIGDGHAPELDEVFGSGTRIRWDFPGLVPIEEAPDAIASEMVERWFASAASAGRTPIALADPGMSTLVEQADGSMRRLVLLGQEAVEDAADRGVETIDMTAVEAAIEAVAELGAQEAASAAVNGSE